MTDGMIWAALGLFGVGTIAFVVAEFCAPEAYRPGTRLRGWWRRWWDWRRRRRAQTRTARKAEAQQRTAWLTRPCANCGWAGQFQVIADPAEKSSAGSDVLLILVLALFTCGAALLLLLFAGRKMGGAKVQRCVNCGAMRPLV